MLNVAYNPQKLTSYRVFDLLYIEQTRRKDRILGHCMAARSDRLQSVQGGDTRRRRAIKIPTPHSPTAKHYSTRTVLSNALFPRSFHQSCIHFQCVIPAELCTPSNASFHRNCTRFQCVIPAELCMPSNASFH
jgi:hypothetical protein